MANNEIITLVKEFLRRLFQEGIIIEKAYLYGSWAKGRENQDSDIDVMLVSDMFDGNNDVLVGKTWRIGRSVDTRIDLLRLVRRDF